VHVVEESNLRFDIYDDYIVHFPVYYFHVCDVVCVAECNHLSWYRIQ
jgi:hypothetical protein